jgi:hypothetical protein
MEISIELSDDTEIIDLEEYNLDKYRKIYPKNITINSYSLFNFDLLQMLLN